MKTYQLFLNGEFVDNGDREMMDVINPSTEEVMSRVPVATKEDVDYAVRSAAKAQKEWAKTTAAERAGYLRELSRLVEENKEALTNVLIAEQGKVRDLAAGEVQLGVDGLLYLAGQAHRVDGDIIAADHPNEHIMVFKKPLGVIAGILPWNYPFYLIIRKMAPALITGNAIVIKSAPETPGIAYEFAKLVEKSSLPKGLVSIVSGAAATGEALSGHPDIAMITLTGSVRAGTGVMHAAAENITKLSLELGGKAPAIVMPDADLESAVEDIYQSRICNSGQVCNCAERVYVHQDIADAFTMMMVERMKKTRVGDPNVIDELDMGPIICQRRLDDIQADVDKAVSQGAKVLLGGKRMDVKGYFFEPTVLVGKHEMEIFRKEVFGPVLPIATFSDFDEAIALANDSEYGLTSSIYTHDADIIMRACNELDFGETYVNRANGESIQGFHAGWKKSGIGGSDGKYGLEEYVQTRVVYLRYDAGKKQVNA